MNEDEDELKQLRESHERLTTELGKSYIEMQEAIEITFNIEERITLIRKKLYQITGLIKQHSLWE